MLRFLKRCLRLGLRYLRRLAMVHDMGGLWRFYRGGGADVVLFCGSPVDWPYLASTSAECRRRGMRSVAVLATLDGVDPAVRKQFDLCISPLALPLLKARVAVTSSSGFPRWLTPRGCRSYVHMPHSLASLHVIYAEGVFDGFDVLLACGPHHARELACMDTLAGRPARPCLPVGYGKMDHLREGLRRARDAGTPAAPSDRPTVLIAPSWAPGNVLEEPGEALVAALLDAGLAVVVRPHPLVFVERPDLVRAMVERFGATGTGGAFALERPDAGDGAIFFADVMISDYSGVAFEFAFLRLRPVVFVNVPPKVENPNWRRLGLEPMEMALRPSVGLVAEPQVDAVVEAVKRLLAEAPQWEPQLRAVRDEYLYHFDGCAGPAADAIEDLLAAPAKPSKTRSG